MFFYVFNFVFNKNSYFWVVEIGSYVGEMFFVYFNNMLLNDKYI